ncbi:MAG TPA: PEP/pyruvate-binding domain-containing protein, partial [Vicinamibacterales bacterium]|nr:PEP/pyruvate-binding domain-containing protein [Vicinamibacterales bacterium]
VNVTTDEILRYAPRRADVINLETRAFETVEFRDLLRDHARDYPALDHVVSVLDEDRMLRPLGFDFDPARGTPVVTFEKLISGTPFMARMRTILAVLREKMGVPVDIEFACDGRDLYLLQCRPQSFTRESTPAAIPSDVPPEHLLFAANKYVSNGRVPEISHILYVDPGEYDRLPRLGDLQDVGRAVGRLNKLLPRRQFVLMGPGRWGSRGDIKLGVSVTYSDINNAAVLMEIAARRGNYVPDLSFGTHFFQDLVEAGIRYLPLFPDEDGQALNGAFLRQSTSILADLLPECAHLARVLRVVDVAQATGGLILRVLMNAGEERAIGLFAPPAFTQGPVAAVERRPPEAPPVTDDHWRWRMRMAERIAAQVDAARYGVQGMYVFGSTKNATAGPESDINLIVHVSGSERSRAELGAWLDGWSLCLSEMNYVRTGYRTTGLLDVHIVTDEDVARQAGTAAKINAVRDPARPLPVGGGGEQARRP